MDPYLTATPTPVKPRIGKSSSELNARTFS